MKETVSETVRLMPYTSLSDMYDCSDLYADLYAAFIASDPTDHQFAVRQALTGLYMAGVRSGKRTERSRRNK